MLAVPHFLGRIIGGPANAELNLRGEIVEHVDLVVDAGILGVAAGGALGIGLKAGMFGGVVIALLRVPFQIVAQIVHHHAAALQIVCGGRDVGREIVQRVAVFLDHGFHRNAAKHHLVRVLCGEEFAVSMHDSFFDTRFSVSE